MEFDLNKVTSTGIIIDNYISFSEDYLKLTTIKKLDNVHVMGRLYYSTTREVIFSGTIKGVMQLEDYHTGELIDYPFKTDIEEVLASDDFFTEKGKNMQNNLDLKEILWQNIVLEVPIRASKTAEVEIKKGEGWEMKDEFSKKEESGLECFKALLDEGKE